MKRKKSEAIVFELVLAAERSSNERLGCILKTVIIPSEQEGSKKDFSLRSK